MGKHRALAGAIATVAGSLLLTAAAPHASAGSTVVVASLVGVGSDVRVVSTTVAADQAEAAVKALAASTGMPAAVQRPVHALTSNDPMRAMQWALDAVSFEPAWVQANGAGVVVAVVDTGVEASHPDLADQVLPAKDYTGEGTADGAGHGTHVAGIIAALSGNRTGISGAAPGVRILPVKVLDSSGAGWNADVAAGIIYAADKGAKVINLSLGGEADSLIEQAVNYATGKGSLVIAAAGNSGDQGNAPSYPAAYPAALAVAATAQDGTIPSFSNHGSYVDIAAPGKAIVSTYKGGGYVLLSGTSMAAPYASAEAALLFSAHPDWSPSQVAAQMTGTAKDIGAAGIDEYSGAGLIDAQKAVCPSCQAPTPGTPGTPATPAPVVPAPTTPPGTTLPTPLLPNLPTPGILPSPGNPGLPVDGGKPVTALPVSVSVHADREWTTPGGLLTLAVNASSDGAALPGASVSVTSPDGRTLSATTGAAGKASVRVTPQAITRYTILVRPAGASGASVSGYTAWVVPKLTVKTGRRVASWRLTPARGQMVTVIGVSDSGERIAARTLVGESGSASGTVRLTRGVSYRIEVSAGQDLLPVKSTSFMARR